MFNTDDYIKSGIKIPYWTDTTGSEHYCIGMDVLKHLIGAHVKELVNEDPAFVKSILGKKRYELFGKGKLTLSAMVTDGKIKRLSG